MLYFPILIAAFKAFTPSSHPSLHITFSTNTFEPGVLFLCRRPLLVYQVNTRWAPPPRYEGDAQLEVVRVLGGPPGRKTLVPVPGHDPLLGGHGAEVHALQPRQGVDDVRPAGGSDTVDSDHVGMSPATDDQQL